MTTQRIERIECPWPESVWRMTMEQYVAAIPDDALRTSISGFLMREGWKVAMGQVRDELTALTAFAEEQEKEVEALKARLRKANQTINELNQAWIDENI